VPINQQQIDPRTGQPVTVNPLGTLDVDIILDEGPDYVNAQADLYEALGQLMPRVSQALSPPEMRALVGILIDASPIDGSAKKKFRDAAAQAAQPNPMAQKAQEIQLAGEAAKVDETKSKTIKNLADAHASGQPDAPEMGDQGDGIDPRIKNMKALAEVDSEHANARHKNAQADKATMDTMLAPQQAAHNAIMDRANLEQGARDKAEDRRLAARATKETA